MYQYRNYFDVIHIQGRNGVLLNLFNRLFPNIVTTIHDLTKEEYEAHITYDKLPKKYRSELFLHHLVFGFIENVCLRKANNVILVSDKLNNYIRALNPDINLHIVPNGTNLHGVSSYTKPIKFLFPGRVEGGKGVHTLIEAFKQVSKVRDNVELIIAGEGILSRNIREIIVKEKLQNKISLTGRINEEEKNQILSESYAIIYPSFSEGKGIAAIEAMSFGKPVIASDIPGLKRVCE